MTNHRLCIAPMMTHTDRHFRYLLRLMSRHVMLYTEMITSGSLLYGDAAGRLAFNDTEHPLGIQLGGSEPAGLAACAKMAAQAGYDEINLNIGCPSDRVKSGKFGACLMAEPQIVADCVDSIKASVDLPVTIKTRIGIDDRDSYEYLAGFIDTVRAGGCKTFIIHARKAWLQGLSPRQNREVPPLRYDLVYRIKRDFPDLEIVINGGFNSLQQVREQYQYVDGVMIGRAVCSNPYLLAQADAQIYADNREVPSRESVLRQYMDYAQQELNMGTSLHHITRHILGLFQGQTGARSWRRYLSERSVLDNAGVEVIEQAMEIKLQATSY